MANAKIYESRTVTVRGESHKMVGDWVSSRAKYSPNKSRCSITQPPRTESVVRIPMAPGSPEVGVISKSELQEGVFMAAALTKVVDGCVVTSILSVNEVETDF
jgi:hypothetical protein